LKRPSSRFLRRAGLALVTALIFIAGGFLLLPLAVQALLRVLDLVLTGCIWLTTSLGSDADAWTILMAVGGAAANALMTTRVLAVFGALVVVSALALYGLQRLLGTEEESSS
jgi:hypothetical protein